MVETLGKRISANRKRLGMTQDQLAEKLGVTAQAVSKWENDQSCPDIQTLPRLAEIFDITTDELLGTGRNQKRVLEAEVVEPEGEDSISVEIPSGLRGGKRFTLGLALWLILSGILIYLIKDKSAVWTVLWSGALVLFGLFGLWPRFSVFRLGCLILGSCSMASLFVPIPDFGWPAVLLVLGGLLLIEALRGKKKDSVQIPVAGKVNTQSSCRTEGESFRCSASFGEKQYDLPMPVLSGGSASLSFGQLDLDLSGCAEVRDGCRLKLETSFGEMNVHLPAGCVVKPDIRTAFGDFQLHGEPDADADRVIYAEGSVSFGEMNLYY